MNDNKEKKELIIYVAVAYGVTFLMGLLMWYGSSRNLDLSMFPNAQMFYPAAGVMLAVLCVRKKDALVPRAFYVLFIGVTLILAAAAVISICSPYTMVFAGGIPVSLWTLLTQVLIIGASVAGWVVLLVTKKEKRKAYGLCWNRGAASWLCIILFLAIYFLRTAVAV
ncbi:MAG: CPBP family intramembrane metalloprotease, partial [Lachnospiraceae bacterium]|nr:CPBP family intramembrane metalloprotease [Lachnospiraceae bacterium]